MKSKYEPLQDYLQNTRASKEAVDLTFAQLETILGTRLPASAHKYREWWSNQKDASNRPQAKAWLSAGYKVEDVQQGPTNARVFFKRTSSKTA